VPLDVEKEDVDGAGLAVQHVDAGLRELSGELALLFDGAAFHQFDSESGHFFSWVSG
jgi:hypothetical protein